MTSVGPDTCKEFMPYSEKDAGFVVCHRPTPCTHEHAKDREVANRFHDWGYNQALTEVYFNILSGMPLHAIKQYVEEGMK